MIHDIIKRDGRREAFNPDKIRNAIRKAMFQTGENDPEVIEEIVNAVTQTDLDGVIGVEEIQDMVEDGLMSSRCKVTAKEYIKYREKRSQIRQRNTELNKKIEDILLCRNVQNQNANVDEHSFGGRKFESANVMHKDIALNALIRPEVAQAHMESRIYIHDLSEYDIGDHNCLFVDLAKQFRDGFEARNGGVRPANCFATACQQTAVVFQAQSQNQFGGVASAHIDYDLAPYVKKSFYKHYADGCKYIGHLDQENVDRIMEDAKSKQLSIDDPYFKANKEIYQYAMEMLERECSQGAEALYHNLNTLESRPGSQVPFTSINFGTDTSPEGRLATKSLMGASIDGIGKHRTTSVFPISIYKYKKGINAKPGDPNYDLKRLAIKSLCKRIYPNIVNCDWSQNVEEPGNPDTEMATMGCRTLIGYDRHGLGYSKVGRGNACPVTMNLPKIGIHHGICLGERSQPDLNGFWEELDEVLELTEKALVDRFYHICNQSVKSAVFMYGNGTIADSDRAMARGIYESMKHCTLAIGYIGVAEMCQALFGKDHSEDKDVHAFALSVIKHISDYAKAASEKHNLNFSCYATPGFILRGLAR